MSNNNYSQEKKPNRSETSSFRRPKGKGDKMIKDLSETVEKMEKENKELREKLIKMEIESNGYKNIIDQFLSNNNLSKENKLKQLKSQIEQLEKEIKSLKDEKEKIQKLKSDRSANLAIVKMENKFLKKQLEEDNKDYSESQMEEENNSLEGSTLLYEDNVSIGEKIKNVIENNEYNYQMIEALEKQIKIKDEFIEELKKGFIELKQQIELNNLKENGDNDIQEEIKTEIPYQHLQKEEKEIKPSSPLKEGIITSNAKAMEEEKEIKPSSPLKEEIITQHAKAMEEERNEDKPILNNEKYRIEGDKIIISRLLSNKEKLDTKNVKITIGSKDYLIPINYNDPDDTIYKTDQFISINGNQYLVCFQFSISYQENMAREGNDLIMKVFINEENKLINKLIEIETKNGIKHFSFPKVRGRYEVKGCDGFTDILTNEKGKVFVEVILNH